MMLKFEGKFELGQRIKAFHFMPMSDRDDQYVIGTIFDDDAISDEGARGYRIDVEVDTLSSRLVGTPVFIPFQISTLEFDERITLA